MVNLYEKLGNLRLQNFLANDWEETREEGEGQKEDLEQNFRMKFTLIFSKFRLINKKNSVTPV